MSRLDAAELRARARRIRLVLMDVDGVLTNGLLFHFVDSRDALVELKGVHTQDSIALSWLADCGFVTGCISGRSSTGMAERLKMLKATYIVQGRLDKGQVFADIGRESRIPAAQTLYIGDDLPDVPVLRAAGIGVAVANARPEVKAAAHWVTKAGGGEGAVRETAEIVLRAQGFWKGILAKFSA